MASLPEKEVFAKTIYAEARGESEEGQIWVAWVIKNRARLNRSYWGGNSIKAVCLHPNQFSCWNGKSDIIVKETATYEEIVQLVDKVIDLPSSNDPTGGADHYLNVDTLGGPGREPKWVNNCKTIAKVGSHTFYKGP